MNTVESLGYLKGLMDGIDLDESKKETKIFKAIIDVLDNLSQDIDDVNEDISMLEEQVDVIDEDLANVEEYLEDEDDYCDGDCDCCDEDCDCEESCTYELECPACHETFEVDEDTILEGGMECPACGEYLEFEVELEDADEAEDNE